MLKLVAKMMADKCFIKDIKPVLQLIGQVDKEFLEAHDKSAIEGSIRYT